MDVTLKTGEVVTIRDHDTLTERLNRPVEIAHNRGAPVRQRLEAAGFKSEDESTWGALSDLSSDDYDRLYAYKSVVIAAMVLKWPWPNPITPDGALDLPPGPFDELSTLCNEAWVGEELARDPDPLAGGVDSTDSRSGSTVEPS
jgi:hypothetical protein